MAAFCERHRRAICPPLNRFGDVAQFIAGQTQPIETGCATQKWETAVTRLQPFALPHKLALFVSREKGASVGRPEGSPERPEYQLRSASCRFASDFDWSHFYVARLLKR